QESQGSFWRMERGSSPLEKLSALTLGGSGSSAFLSTLRENGDLSFCLIQCQCSGRGPRASRSSVIQCKPGGNCPSRHRGMTRQLSPLSVAEDSAAPILELQNRSPSGICRHSRVERQSRSGEEGTQTHTESSSQEAEGQTRCQSCTSTFLKLIWRFLIILSVSSSWVGTTQFVKITYETFDCPFFMTWFSTNWNIMVFPIYYSGHLATAQEKQSPIKKFR
ncbi:solute carrier family 35 member F4-like, partial [Antrostomus carolinensis]|uniref:solute carrier family 35 member F4-like n=1 Tax=Antrostomus carolinensis TaxID=279965 RepID=UPI0010A98085